MLPMGDPQQPTTPVHPPLPVTLQCSLHICRTATAQPISTSLWLIPSPLNDTTVRANVPWPRSSRRMSPILRLLMAKLPSHTPRDPLPCPGGRSDGRLWKDDWQTPLLYPSGNRRKPRCFSPGETKKCLLNGNYSSGKCTDKAYPNAWGPGLQPKGNQGLSLYRTPRSRT